LKKLALAELVERGLVRTELGGGIDGAGHAP
jgi:hypothetical protein